MEYMENTFKMHKETKRNTVIRKAKRAQKEKIHYQAKSGPSRVEKKNQTQIKRSPIGIKLHRGGPDIPRSPPCEGGGDQSHSRGGQPIGLADPHLVLFGPNFGRLVLTASPTSVAWVFAKGLVWRMAICSRQEGMHVSTTPLHLHHTSYDGLIQGLWWRGTWIADMAH